MKNIIIIQVFPSSLLMLVNHCHAEPNETGQPITSQMLLQVTLLNDPS